MKYFYKKWGFTLVELMIVIAIIGILAAVLFPSVTGYFERARDTEKKLEIGKLWNAIISHQINNGTFRIIGSGVNGDNGGGEWWGWMLLKNHNYPKSIIKALTENGYYKGKLQENVRNMWENQNTIEDASNEPFCNKVVVYPYEFMLTTDIDDTRFQISTYLEKSTQKNKEYIQSIEDFDGKRRYIDDRVNEPQQWSCERYGRNYVVEF